MISWPVLGVRHVSPEDFVRFWEQCYSGYDEKFYQENIGKPLTDKRIAEWFQWKNGTPLSALVIWAILLLLVHHAAQHGELLRRTAAQFLFSLYEVDPNLWTTKGAS